MLGTSKLSGLIAALPARLSNLTKVAEISDSSDQKYCRRCIHLRATPSIRLRLIS
jgi:hypothetical protein